MHNATRWTRTGILLTAGIALAACREAAQPTAPNSNALKTDSPPSFTVGAGQTVTTLGRSTVDPFHIHSEYNRHRVEIKSDESDINVNSASLAPGGNTGWHSHSGPVMVVVTSGSFTMYRGNDDQCQRTVYPAGRAFVEPGGLDDVHIGRNEGSVPVTWVATAILPVGVAGRIDAPSPGNCPF